MGAELRSVDVTAFAHFKGGKKLEQVVLGEGAVGVEVDAVDIIDRHGDIEVAARLDDAFQFKECLNGTLRVERVAVAAQADVFDHAQAGDRGDARIRER